MMLWNRKVKISEETQLLKFVFKSKPQQFRLCVKHRDRCYHTYSHHSLKTLTNQKPRRAGVHTLPYIHIHTHTEVTSRSLIFEQFWLPILIVSLCSIPNIYIQVLQGIISQSKLKDKVDWFTVIILKYRYQERKHFFWGMYIWISNNYWYSITGTGAAYWDSNMTSFQYGRQN